MIFVGFSSLLVRVILLHHMCILDTLVDFIQSNMNMKLNILVC